MHFSLTSCKREVSFAVGKRRREIVAFFSHFLQAGGVFCRRQKRGECVGNGLDRSANRPVCGEVARAKRVTEGQITSKFAGEHSSPLQAPLTSTIHYPFIFGRPRSSAPTNFRERPKTRSAKHSITKHLNYRQSESRETGFFAERHRRTIG